MSEEVKSQDNFVPDLETPSDAVVNDQIDIDELSEEAPPSETVLDEPELMPNDAEADLGKSNESSSEDADKAVQSSDETDLQKEVASLTAQLEDRTGQYMRLAADFDNYRKRTIKEKGEFEDRAKCNTIVELLPVIDNFERARSQIKPQTDAESAIQKSYQGIYKQLVDALKQLGVSPMRPEGEPFDPNFHEAVMREPTNEHPEGTVIEELRRGYILGEQVIRHAMVKVAAPADPSPAEPTSEASEQVEPA